MLKIQTTDEQDYRVIALDGEIDATSSIQVDQAIIEAKAADFAKILIDCFDLEYISSAGLGVFMSHIRDFKEEGVSMIIFGLSENTFQVFSILGLDKLLTITENKAEALAKWV